VDLFHSVLRGERDNVFPWRV